MGNLRKQSNTLIIPLGAIAAIAWGTLFYVGGRIHRTSVVGYSTTLAWLPYWAWSVMFVGAGVVLLWTLADWAVAALVAVITLYALTLGLNALLVDGAPLTGIVWPSFAACCLFVAAHRAGVRKLDR